jgi:type IV secretion system protein VirD4
VKWNRLKKFLIIFIIIAAICYAVGFLFNTYISGGFRFVFNPRLFIDGKTVIYTGVLLLVALFLLLWYYHKHFWLFHSRNVIKGNKRDSDIKVNLEQARFEDEKEINRNFPRHEYAELHEARSGIPVRAEQDSRGKYNINLSGNAHTLIIGTTGSGKTTTYISPTIQILSETKTKPSLLISDPKGELYMLHAKALEKKGYTIKILDLRNPFNSIKWNPLERAFRLYQRMLHLKDEVIQDDDTGEYHFEDKTFNVPAELDGYLQVKKQQLYDLVYEDLHDIISALCPVTNKHEPIWESGAKNFCLSVALAMLEDSENPALGMTVDKYNFFNLMKVATNTEDDCESLMDYFANRSPLSKCISLSKQVLDSAEKTRGSYLSTLFDRLNMFADLSLCSLTSENEITFEDLAETPTAVFLQVPDERETRHALAAIVILQAYKELVQKANKYPDLCLPRPVYFLLDEFGNMPAVHKLEQMITVGRSRNIWLNLVVQSYAQLAKVYDDKVAEIIKSNCNIQIFIGTTDLKTIEDFSKRCGNFTVITRNVGYNTVKADDINSNASIKERPLIYPSELQQLNSPSNMGNAIVTVFGYQPIRSRFTPSFRVSAFNLEKTTEKEFRGRFFDEVKIFYDMRRRNAHFAKKKPPKKGGVGEKEAKVLVEHLMELAERSLKDVLTDKETAALITALQNARYQYALRIVEEANTRAIKNNELAAMRTIQILLTDIRKLNNNIRDSLNQIGGNISEKS